MSTTDTTLVSPAESPRADDLWAPDITLPRVVRSEWIKSRSVRSRIVTLGLTACAVIATGALVSMLGDGAPVTVEDGTIYDPAGSSSFGATIARLVLGALVATLFVLPALFETLGGVRGRASEYLPGEAGEAMTTVVRE